MTQPAENILRRGAASELGDVLMNLHLYLGLLPWHYVFDLCCDPNHSCIRERGSCGVLLWYQSIKRMVPNKHVHTLLTDGALDIWWLFSMTLYTLELDALHLDSAYSNFLFWQPIEFLLLRNIPWPIFGIGCSNWGVCCLFRYKLLKSPTLLFLPGGWSITDYQY